jgi:Flp pilus assembly protein TadG
MKKLQMFAKQFAQSERGAVLPLVGLGFMMLITVVGLAVDYGRAQMVQSKLHAALDAAGLAAASVAQSRTDAQIRVEVQKFMEANFPQDYMNSHATGNSPYPGSFVTRIDIQRSGNNTVSLDLRAEATVDTAIMRVVGYDEMDVAAETEISQERSNGFEMVLVLDNTGSMEYSGPNGTRMQALKMAVTDMLNIFYGETGAAGNVDSYDNMFIGIVPFGRQVNVGSAQATGSRWMKPNAAAANSVAGTVYCVDDGPEDRDVQYATTNVRPASAATYFVQNQVNKQNCGIRQMTPMRTSRAQIQNAVDAMSGAGTTRADIGAAWGWRMLSPSWQGMWNHSASARFNNLPLPRNTKGMDKVVVILTDGENTWADGNGEKDVVTPVSPQQANQRLLQVCTGMKNEGIIVYTITLVDQKNAALMRACATTSDHYYHADGADSVRFVFRQIADSLMNLRLSR